MYQYVQVCTNLPDPIQGYRISDAAELLMTAAMIQARASSHWKQVPVLHHDVTSQVQSQSTASETWDLAQVQVMQEVQFQKLRPRRLIQGIIRLGVTRLHAQ